MYLICTYQQKQKRRTQLQEVKYFLAWPLASKKLNTTGANNENETQVQAVPLHFTTIFPSIDINVHQ